MSPVPGRRLVIDLSPWAVVLGLLRSPDRGMRLWADRLVEVGSWWGQDPARTRATRRLAQNRTSASGSLDGDSVSQPSAGTSLPAAFRDRALCGEYVVLWLKSEPPSSHDLDDSACSPWQMPDVVVHRLR